MMLLLKLLGMVFMIFGFFLVCALVGGTIISAVRLVDPNVANDFLSACTSLLTGKIED